MFINNLLGMKLYCSASTPYFMLFFMLFLSLCLIIGVIILVINQIRAIKSQIHFGLIISLNLRLLLVHIFVICLLMSGIVTELLFKDYLIMAVVPIITYSNPDTQKLDILKDNKGKSGIYR